MPSFYIDFIENTFEIEVFDEEFHHIKNVFRHQKGDVLTLINGKGRRARGTICEIKKKSVLLEISENIYVEKPNYKVGCAFSLLKNKHDLTIIEKLTELGVDDLFPMTTIHSVKLSGENTLNKMEKTSISAAKQCGNAWLPKIHGVSDLNNIFIKLKEKGYSPILASETLPDVSLCEYIKTMFESKQEFSHKTRQVSLCMIIGPEGGFDKNEFALFDKLSVPRVRISRNILRAETAAICAVSQIMGNMDFTR